jgi:hypothetical protein
MTFEEWCKEALLYEGTSERDHAHFGWHARDAEMADQEERIRLQSLRYAAEIEWWHRQWHRATGIPCDGTMEVCKRHQGCREIGMPALADLQARIERVKELADRLLAEHQATGSYAEMDMDNTDRAYVAAAKLILVALDGETKERE